MNELFKNRKALFAGVAVAAVCVAVALVLVSVLGSGSKKKASPGGTTSTTTTQTTTGGVTKVPGAAATAALFAGIPQRLNELGNAKAGVTMVEFADLQCPYCRAYAVDALPTIVQKYVRTGKVKLVFSGMHFVGPDSEKGLRAVLAAGLQGKLWNALDLLYKSQGQENSGWVPAGLLRSVGASIPGLDGAKMIADTSSTKVDNGLAASDQEASQAGVNSTPTFFAGPTGATLQHMNVTALTPAAFAPTLDALLK